MTADPQPDVALPLSPTDLLRLPSVDRAGERVFVEANQRRVADAFILVEQVFGAGASSVVGPASTRRAEVVPVRGLPATAEVWSLIDDLFVHEDMRPPHLAFELTGALVDDRIDMRASYQMFRPDVHGIAGKLRGRAAMLLRWIDEYYEPLWSLCAAIEAITGAGARVSCFVMPEGDRLLPEAPPDADRLVIPLEGDLRVAASFGPVGELDVAPGAGVLTPCGSSVSVSGSVPATILIVDVGRVRTSSLVEFAADNARFFPLMRADVPADLDGPIHSYAGSIFDHPDDFEATAAQVLSRESMDRAVAIRRSQLPNRVRQVLSDLLRFNAGANARLRAVHSGGITIAEGATGSFPAIAGMRLVLQPESTSALAQHLDGRIVEAEALQDVLAPHCANAEAIVRFLVEIEVFEVVGLA